VFLSVKGPSKSILEILDMATRQKLVQAVKVLRVYNADSENSNVLQLHIMTGSHHDTDSLYGWFNVVATACGLVTKVSSDDEAKPARGEEAPYDTDEDTPHDTAEDTHHDDTDEEEHHDTAREKKQSFHRDVYNMIQGKLRNTPNNQKIHHRFFLFHPEKFWHTEFIKLVSNEKLDRRFCGYADDIDDIFIFMKIVRQILNQEEEVHKKDLIPVQLHLLIPAYKDIVIEEARAVKIPGEIKEFVMEGQGIAAVHINLPLDQEHYLQDISIYNKSPSILESVYAFFGSEENHTVLGRMYFS
jgi:hypothetical protein